MRGSVGNIQDVNPVEVSQQVEVGTPVTTELEKNLEQVKDKSVWAWAVALIIIALWAGARKNEKVQEALEPHKFLDVALDVFGLGFLAAVGIKGLQVFFTKLAASKIPVLNKIAAFFLPIFV